MPLLILGFFLLAINAGDTLYEADKAANTTRDIFNYTESHFLWNSSVAPITELNETHNKSEALSIRINNILNKGIDWLGFSFMETGKLGVEMGYHGEGNFKMIGLLKLIKWVLLIMLIYFLLMPTAAVILLAWHSYDWIKKRLLKK